MRRAKYLFFVLYLLALLGGFVLFASHRSHSPAFLGRYTTAYMLFLLACAAFIIVSLALFFSRRRNNMRRILQATGSATIFKFTASLLLVLLVLTQVSLYPHPGINWGYLWFPVVLLALLFACALLSSGDLSFSIVARIERCFASRFATGVLTFCATMLICIVCVEMALRIWRPSFAEYSFWVKDPNIGFRVRPGCPGTNSLGFRDDEHPFEKDEGVYRILALGDSFEFGTVPRRYNYLTLLEEMLGEVLQRRVEIINAGVPGYGSREELRLLRYYGPRYRPDHVMLNFFIGNDLWDNQPGIKEKIILNGMIFNEHVFPLGTFLFQYWYLHHYLRVGWEAYSHRPDEPQAASPGSDHAASAPGGSERENRVDPREVSEITEAFLQEEEFIDLQTSVAALFLLSEEKRTRKSFAYVSSFFEQMKAFSGEMGASFSIVVIPDQIQVDGRLREKILELGGWKEDEFDFEITSALFRDFGEEHGVPVLDLLPLLREGCREKNLYGRQDIHWNRNGNLLAAKAIAEFWRNHTLGQ